MRIAVQVIKDGKNPKARVYVMNIREANERVLMEHLFSIIDCFPASTRQAPQVLSDSLSNILEQKLSYRGYRDGSIKRDSSRWKVATIRAETYKFNQSPNLSTVQYSIEFEETYRK